MLHLETLISHQGTRYVTRAHFILISPFGRVLHLLEVLANDYSIIGHLRELLSLAIHDISRNLINVSL
jgi:hypothetical protein